LITILFQWGYSPSELSYLYIILCLERWNMIGFDLSEKKDKLD